MCFLYVFNILYNVLHTGKEFHQQYSGFNNIIYMYNVVCSTIYPLKMSNKDKKR